MPTLGHGSPPKAGMQTVNDRFVETLPRTGKPQVTNRFAEIPILPNPGCRRTEAQMGTDVRDSPVRTRPAASASVKGTNVSWNMKRGGRSDDTLDSGMGTLQWHGTGPRLESLLRDTIIGRGIRGVVASMPILRPN